MTTEPTPPEAGTTPASPDDPQGALEAAAQPPAPGRSIGLVKKLISPTGLVLVLMFLALPFAEVSCSVLGAEASATYSGYDLAFDGDPALDTGSDRDLAEAAQSNEEDPLGVQPLAVTALLAVIAGIAIAAITVDRMRLLLGAIAAGWAAIALTFNQIVVDGLLVDALTDAGGFPPNFAATMVEGRFGFGLSLFTLIVVAAANVVQLLWPGVLRRITASISTR